MEVQMKAIKYPLFKVYLLFSVVLISSASYSGEAIVPSASVLAPADAVAKVSLADQVKAMDKMADPAGWKVRNGCLSANRIKRIKFIDDQTALITMFGKKTAILRLQKECPGIKRSGYVTYRSNSRLCARFDRLSVMGGSGYSCRIASIEPFVTLEEPVLEKDND